MVYTGKPSKGCQNCKSRHIKCDEARPTCGQCRRSKRLCPGYKDEFDLMLRNETASTRRKAQAAAGSSGSQSRKGSNAGVDEPTLSRSASMISLQTTGIDGGGLFRTTSQPSTLPANQYLFVSELPQQNEVSRQTVSSQMQSLEFFDTNRQQLDDKNLDSIEAIRAAAEREYSSSALPAELNLATIDIALEYVFNNFSSCPRHPESTRGYLELLPQLYRSAEQGSALRLVAHAMALTTWGLYTQDMALMTLTKQVYGKAICEVRKILLYAHDDKSDQLLMCMLLLVAIEIQTPRGEDQPFWTHHARGAVALVKSRGREMLNSPISLHLFQAARSMMLGVAIIRDEPIDAFPHDGDWWIDQYANPNAANRLTRIELRLPNLGLMARQILKTADTLVERDFELVGLIDVARAIDNDLKAWSQSLPEDWAPQLVHVQEMIPDDEAGILRATCWPGPVVAYSEVMIALLWIEYRLSRIFCQAIIIALVRAMSDGNQQTEVVQQIVQEAFSVETDMMDEICSTIPYMLYDVAEDRASAGKMDRSGLEIEAAHYALWPLYAMQQNARIPMKQKTWVRGRFIRCGQTLHINEQRAALLARNHTTPNAPFFEL